MSNQKVLLPLLVEGKTKKVWVTSRENEVLIENKDSITADDGRRQDTFESKAALVTHITSNCFELLHRAGVSTHFIKRESSVSFRAKKLDMIPMEIVVRRRAFGSFLERYPDTERGSYLEPLVVEFFQKNNFMHDPFLQRIGRSVRRHDAHKPLGQGVIDLCLPSVAETFMVGRWHELEYIARRAFTVLEVAWAAQYMTLADMKIECGVTSDGELVIGDVIDNDSWRLWRDGNADRAVDKQLYIDGYLLEHVARQYESVAGMTTLFTHVPLVKTKSLSMNNG